MQYAPFEGLPLLPGELFPPEPEFQILCEVSREISIPYDPQNEAMLSCLKKGWLHMEMEDDRRECCMPSGAHR